MFFSILARGSITSCPQLPVETIVKAAKEMDAEAIVMFSDGRDDLTDRLFGSITEHVLRNTPLPVLVVRQ